MHIFHKWGPWKQYEQEVPERRLTRKLVLCAVTELRQRKYCEVRGKAKDELINSIVQED